jgi:dUTPase
MIDPDYHGKIGLLFYNGGKKNFIWTTGDPLGNF